jgi:hypothetical protein
MFFWPMHVKGEREKERERVRETRKIFMAARFA